MNDTLVFIYLIFFVMLFASTFAFMFKMMGSTLNDFNKPTKRNVHPEMEDVKSGESLLVFSTRKDDDDEIIYLPISENIHINNILHKSLVPADINEDSTEQIKNITKKIIRELNYKGIICIEFFIDTYDNILVNEIAPRTHNSGHYSIEGLSLIHI